LPLEIVNALRFSLRLGVAAHQHIGRIRATLGNLAGLGIF
jgi:hypothetical protein